MKPVTDAFTDMVARSHTIAVRVEVLRSGTVIADIDEVVDGTVALDGRAKIRGRCDVTLGPSWVPVLAGDAVAPFGNELRVSRGVQLPTGPEYVVLGVFRIEDVDVADSSGSLTVRVSGRDRSAAVSDARFTAPYAIAAGTNVTTAIQAMVDAGVSGITWLATPTASTTPALVHAEGTDRWDAAIAMAESIGYEVFFDGAGNGVLQPEPDPTAGAVLTVAEGGVLISATKRWTRIGAYNAVIATGEATSNTTPARGEAYDTDPTSPTLYGGPFGQVPRFYSSSFIATDTQAADAAAAILRRQLGVTEQVSFDAVPHPALEPGDVVQITRTRLGLDASHVIDAITIPLGTAPISASTRSRQVAA